MVDLVRCKLQASFSRTALATQVSLSAVYEGNAELQALSENALFGKASPSCWMSLNIEEPDLLGYFVSGEEYCVDAQLAHGVFSHATKPGAFKVRTRATFVSEHNPNFPGQRSVTMTVVEPPNITGQKNLTVHNENVFDFYKQGAEYDLVIYVARGGRRSDEEIAIRERQLAEAVENATKQGADPSDEKQGYGIYIAGLRKKLARAKGEAQ